MACGPAELTLCEFVSAVSECDLAGNVFAHLADPCDRAAVRAAVDALALLEPGQCAGDAARWHVHVLRLGVTAAPPPAWWQPTEPGRIVQREFLIGGRVQRVALRVPAGSA